MLTDTVVRNAQPAENPYKVADGGGARSARRLQDERSSPLRQAVGGRSTRVSPEARWLRRQRNHETRLEAARPDLCPHRRASRRRMVRV